MKTYYHFLKHTLENYGGDFDRVILYLPEMFKLLCDVLEQNLEPQARAYINAALAYFIRPNDLIPEDLYGPAGYIDDLFICTSVIRYLIETIGIARLEPLWSHEEDFAPVIEMAWQKSYAVMAQQGLLAAAVEMTGLPLCQGTPE
jgi:uncharacterized membrane protein YkvA (DUF1232 family)